MIQEWEPDQGLELERRSPGWPARAHVAGSRLLGRGEDSGVGALWAACGEGSFLPVLREKTADREPGGYDQGDLLSPLTPGV